MITGPSITTVGVPARFKAEQNDNPVEVTWTVPPDAATIEPESPTSAVFVTPSKQVDFTLQVKKDDVSREMSIRALYPPAEQSSLPFVGEGYGTILLALAILTLATVLALMGKFSTDALATLFGALGGYIFYRAAGGAGGGGNTGDDSTAR